MQATPIVLPCKRPVRIHLEVSSELWGRLPEFTLVLTACDSFINNNRDNRTELINGFPVSHSTNSPLSLPIHTEDAPVFSCTATLPREGEYILRLLNSDGGVADHACVYAVDRELQGLYPFKGDLHLHSIHSDGCQSPREIAVAARQAGFSFMALTDHGKMAASLDLQADVESFDSPYFCAYPGEEVHLPRHQVHILNIGGTGSVNQFVQDFPTAYAAECRRTMEQNPPSEADGFHLAAARWAFDKIRELDGLSIFSHPFWRRDSGLDLGLPLTDALLDHPTFDALELISGYPREQCESNLLQLARYSELLLRGVRPPIVGASDGHDCTQGSEEGQFGCFYTALLSTTPNFTDVAQSIRECRSVAVEQLPGEQLHMYGPYRYVKYLLFLTREFFPVHDRLAEEESAHLARHFDKKAFSSTVSQVHSRLHDLYKTAFDW